MSIKEFLEKWKINKSQLAIKLQYSTMTFINRYKEPTPEDEEKLRKVLEEMQRDLRETLLKKSNGQAPTNAGTGR